MFCFQCQETMKNQGCSVQMGVCGKKDTTADLQDLLIYTAKGVARTHSKLRTLGKTHDEAYDYLLNSLFITITNANFDDDMIEEEIKRGTRIRDEIKAMVGAECDSQISSWQPESREKMLEIAKGVGVLRTENEDVRSLRELVLYGLKGMAAYTHHAMHIGKKDESILIFLEKALKAVDDDTLTADQLVALVLETGEYGVKAMALLDSANTSALGSPVATSVNIGVGTNPGILVTGHDLNDLRQLLEQTEGKGIDIYTHSEMLPAHGYPELKKFSHLVGNYGTAWHGQRDDFENFNGPVIFTTNCIVPPKKDATYNHRIFTANATGFPGWKKVKVNADGTKDFSEVIEMAKTTAAPKEMETGNVMTGFAHDQVFKVLDTVVDAVKSGAIKKFIVMAGCDGRMMDRSYYTEFAKALPNDTIILTAGCAKFRYNKLPLGDIGGIPRVLDAGQCNDSYSLALIALKLKEVFGVESVNELPLAYNIAWYEQKAVIVLLALLYLGVKNIHLGPTLPAFLSPNVAKVLVDTFGIAPITTVENDMKIFGL